MWDDNNLWVGYVNFEFYDCRCYVWLKVYF